MQEQTREAVLILPVKGNGGDELTLIHALLRAHLLRTFGGYTSQNVQGAWRDPEDGRAYVESSVEYRVAAVWTDEARANLEKLAAHYAHMARQLSLYLRDDMGAVHFVSPREAPELVAGLDESDVLAHVA
jgi:hypothetical protein